MFLAVRILELKRLTPRWGLSADLRVYLAAKSADPYVKNLFVYLVKDLVNIQSTSRQIIVLPEH